MKKLGFSLLGFFIALSINAQAPNLFNYQAVVRDVSGAIQANLSVSIDVSIIQGSVDGSILFTETHTGSTNDYGLITLSIGIINPTDFMTIDWGAGPYFLKVSVNGAELGTTQLLSVPYALFANTSGSSSGAVTLSGDQTITGNKTFSGTTSVANPVNASDAVTKEYVDELKAQIEELYNLAGVAVKDIDGNNYGSVTIGSQVWMSENLKATKYSDGTEINNITDAAEWDALTTPGYCWFNNDISNKKMYGSLYNWNTIDQAINGGRNVCPAGWHVATDAEWLTLINYLIDNGYGYGGSGDDVAKSIASKSNWLTDPTPGNVGNDQASNNGSGFNAVPGGVRAGDGSFQGFGEWTNWWTSTPYNENANVRSILYNNNTIGGTVHARKTGNYVRCIKDLSPSSDVFGLYAIKTGTDELYFIDLGTSNITKIANIGIVIPDMFTGMQFREDKLYIVTGDKLYTYDIATGQLELLITNSNLQWQFSINSAGDLYSVTEVSGPAQGSVYKIDISSNSSTLVGTTGTASVWGMGFDSSNQLWAVDEFYQKYGTINTTTGTFTATSTVISFTDTYYSTPDNKGNLYSFNVGIPRGIIKYNISSDTPTLLIPSSDTWGWAGLAYGPLYLK